MLFFLKLQTLLFLLLLHECVLCVDGYAGSAQCISDLGTSETKGLGRRLGRVLRNYTDLLKQGSE